MSVWKLTERGITFNKGKGAEGVIRDALRNYCDGDDAEIERTLADYNAMIRATPLKTETPE